MARKIKAEKLEKPTWLKYTEKDVKDIIIKLADQGISSEKIGIILRDQYGIPKTRLYGFKIKEVIGEKFEEPTIINLDNKLKKIIKHYDKNKQDKKAERSLIITRAKFKKTKDYYDKN